MGLTHKEDMNIFPVKMEMIRRFVGPYNVVDGVSNLTTDRVSFKFGIDGTTNNDFDDYYTLNNVKSSICEFIKFPSSNNTDFFIRAREGSLHDSKVDIRITDNFTNANNTVANPTTNPGVLYYNEDNQLDSTNGAHRTFSIPCNTNYYDVPNISITLKGNGAQDPDDSSLWTGVFGWFREIILYFDEDPRDIGGIRLVPKGVDHPLNNTYITNRNFTITYTDGLDNYLIKERVRLVYDGTYLVAKFLATDFDDVLDSYSNFSTLNIKCAGNAQGNY